MSTLSEQEKIAEIERQLAELDARIAAQKPSNPAYKQVADAAASTAKSVVLQGGATAIGQGIGAFPPFAAATGGLSIPAGGAAFSVLGYLADEMTSGRRPTLGGAGAAAASGAIPGGFMAKAATPVATALARGAATNVAITSAEAASQGRVPEPLELAVSAVGGAGGGLADKYGKPSSKSVLRQEQALKKSERDQWVRTGRALVFLGWHFAGMDLSVNLFPSREVGGIGGIELRVQQV
jgi:hypothetical protein